MNRNFENRKPTKVCAKGKENQMIIKALNMYGRVPETWELLEEIERLNNIIEDFEIELQREINVREEDTSLEHNTFIIIQNTLKTALKRFQELTGSSNNE